MAGKVKPVKWAIGAEEPDELEEFLSNDEIMDKNTNKKTQEVAWPGKGPFRFKVAMPPRIKPNKNGDDRIGVMLSLQQPKGEEGSEWNGYVVWDGFNVTEQGKQFLNRWLKAIGVTWADFMTKSRQVDGGNGKDFNSLVQIAGVKFGDVKDVYLRATVTVKDADDYNDDEHMEIRRYLPLNDGEAEDEAEEAEEEEVEEFTEAESEFEDDPAEDLRQELLDMKGKALKARALENDPDADLSGLDKDQIIELILEQEIEWEEEAEEEAEEEEDPEEELRAELKPMTVVALTKRAQRTAKKFKGDPNTIPHKKADLIDWIVNAELGEPPF